MIQLSARAGVRVPGAAGEHVHERGRAPVERRACIGAVHRASRWCRQRAANFCHPRVREATVQHRMAADTGLHRLCRELENGAPEALVPIDVARGDFVHLVHPTPCAAPWGSRRGEVDATGRARRLHDVLERERRLDPREADLEVSIFVGLGDVAVAALRHRVIAPLVDALEHASRVAGFRGRPVVAQHERIVLKLPTGVAGRRGVGRIQHRGSTETIVGTDVRVVVREIAERLVIGHERDLTVLREGANVGALVADAIEYTAHGQERNIIWIDRVIEDHVGRVHVPIGVRRETPLLAQELLGAVILDVTHPLERGDPGVVVPIELVHDVHRHVLHRAEDGLDVLGKVQGIAPHGLQAVRHGVVCGGHQAIPLVIGIREVDLFSRRIAGDSAIALETHHRLKRVQPLEGEALLAHRGDAGGKAGTNREAAAFGNHSGPGTVEAVDVLELGVEIVLSAGEQVADVRCARDCNCIGHGKRLS